MILYKQKSVDLTIVKKQSLICRVINYTDYN